MIKKQSVLAFLASFVVAYLAIYIYKLYVAAKKAAEAKGTSLFI